MDASYLAAVPALSDELLALVAEAEAEGRRLTDSEEERLSAAIASICATIRSIRPPGVVAVTPDPLSPTLACRVRQLAAAGIPQRVIALRLGISRSAVRWATRDSIEQRRRAA